MSPKSIIDLDRRHVWHPFTQEQTAPLPLEIERGEGAYLYTPDGTKIVDMISSWWVNLHGHGHKGIAGAIGEQAAKLEQVIFAGFTHKPAATLASKICNLLPGDLNRAFFSDDGSTAVEVGIKLCLQSWRNQGMMDRHQILAFEGAYHGDTFGAMSLGRSSGYFSAFEREMFPVHVIDYPETWEDDPDVDEKEARSLSALKTHLENNQGKVALMIMEPLMQGASGMRMCRPSFLKSCVALLKEHGVLVVFDEVMTGFGRLGDLFACLKAEVEPDVVCLSKGLTGGFLAMSMTVVSDRIYDSFLGQDFTKAFAHGHSFTANPLGCAAGLASLELLLDENCTRQRQQIERLNREITAPFKDHPNVEHVRICGTIAAISLVCPDGGYNAAVGAKVKQFFTEQGFLIRPLGNVVYTLPPYCINPNDLKSAWKTIYKSLSIVV